MKKTSIVMSLILAFAMVLTACGKAVPKLIEIAAPDGVLEIELDVGDTTILELAKTFAPDEVTDEQISEAMAAANLTWKSDNPGVVEVIPDDGGGSGILKAKTEGIAQVEISGSSGEATLLVAFKVTVVKPVVELDSIDVIDSISLAVGSETSDTEQLHVTVNPANASEVEVSFVSSDEAVVKVDADGLATGIDEGKASITVTAKGVDANGEPVELTQEVAVEVFINADSIHLDSTAGWIYIGGTHTLNPYLMPENASPHPLTYTSSDESVATVDENGVITGKAVGAAVITATSEYNEELTIEYTITVKKYVAPSGGNGGGSNGSGNTPAGGNGGSDNGGDGTIPTQPSNPAPQPDPAPAPEPDIPFNPLPEVPYDPGDLGGF